MDVPRVSKTLLLSLRADLSQYTRAPLLIVDAGEQPLAARNMGSPDARRMFFFVSPIFVISRGERERAFFFHMDFWNVHPSSPQMAFHIMSAMYSFSRDLRSGK